MNKKEGGRIKPMKKKIPQFKSEKEEKDFWQTHDSKEYVDWKKAERITLSSLKPSVKTISLRLPEAMLEELKLLANKRDVPYQSLIKVFLSDRIEQELTAKGHNMSLHRSAKKAGSR
jgi:predicted DNA binding CopG/RHH family protein